jgi:MYXO-CTERM domain-containing protein
MSGALRRVLTAKTLALAALALASLAMSVVWRRRELDADSSWHPEHEVYPPHVKPGW